MTSWQFLQAVLDTANDQHVWEIAELLTQDPGLLQHQTQGRCPNKVPKSELQMGLCLSASGYASSRYDA